MRGRGTEPEAGGFVGQRNHAQRRGGSTGDAPGGRRRTLPQGRAGSASSGARGEEPVGSRRWAREGEQAAGDGEHLRLG
ncbi:unnamed protein product [Triticum turgidum subsp. durum]|nr:unnamed protein product [Triticum turgidum subsp. durum]